MKTSIAGLIGAVVLLVIVVASYVPDAVGTLILMILAVLFGYGWPQFLAVPAKKTLGTVLAVTGVLAQITAFLSPAPTYLLWAAPIAAVGSIGVFIVELLRGTGQPHRLESTFGCISAVALTVSASGWLAAARLTDRSDVLLITGFSAIVVVLVSMIPWPDVVVAPFGLVLGTLAGPLAALLFGDGHILAAAITGLVVAAVLLAFRRLGSSPAPVRGSLGMVASSLAPIFSIGVVVYMADKLLFV